MNRVINTKYVNKNKNIFKKIKIKYEEQHIDEEH